MEIQPERIKKFVDINIYAIQQERIKKFVDINIYANVSYLVQEILKTDHNSSELISWEKIEELENYEEGTELLEWFLVSDFLAEKIEAYGGIVLRDNCDQNFWGCTEMGLQHVDRGIIKQIYKELNE